MASSLVVPVVELKRVRAHPDANKLELCDVLGYQLCIPKGRHKTGDLGIYFPADTILTKEWAEKFGVTSLLKGAQKDRVGKIALRGEPSFGLFVPIPEDLSCQLGDNVAEFFGAKKYEPPVRATCGDPAGYDSDIDPFVQKYTDIQNGRIFTEIFSGDELVVATEKIHGTNCKIGYIRVDNLYKSTMLLGSCGPGVPTKYYTHIAGSMELRRKWPHKTIGPKNLFEKIIQKIWGEKRVKIPLEDMGSNTYWHPWSLGPVRDLMVHVVSTTNNIGMAANSVLLYGEVYGGAINFDYGIPNGKGLGFKAFDISIDGKYMDFETFEALCDKFSVPRVPVLYKGPFRDFKPEIADGASTIEGARNIREGVVIKPLIERIDPKVGRACCKIIGTQYALGLKDNEDNKDS